MRYGQPRDGVDCGTLPRAVTRKERRAAAESLGYRPPHRTTDRSTAHATAQPVPDVTAVLAALLETRERIVGASVGASPAAAKRMDALLAAVDARIDELAENPDLQAHPEPAAARVDAVEARLGVPGLLAGGGHLPEGDRVSITAATRREGRRCAGELERAPGGNVATRRGLLFWAVPGMNAWT